MLRIALMLCLLAWAPAEAALSYFNKGGDGQRAGLRLSDAPCTNEKVLAALKAKVPERFHARFKAAVLTWDGRQWHSCWVRIEVQEANGEETPHIWSIDEEGAPLDPPNGIPLRLFRDDSV